MSALRSHTARHRAALGAVVLLLALQAAFRFAARDAMESPAAPPGAIAAASAGPPDAHLRIDPNTASAAELMLLPGVGPVVAQNIIDYRASCGRSPAFRVPADLDAVPRIGPATIARFASHLALPAGVDPRLAAGAPRP